MHAWGAAELRQVLPRNCTLHDNPLLLYRVPLTSQLTHTHTHTPCPSPRGLPHTHVSQCQGLCRPAPLYLHEAEIMASVAAPFVSAVPGPCSLLVPISWLLARWPLCSTLCCLTEKIQETPVPSSNSLFHYTFLPLSCPHPAPPLSCRLKVVE